MRSAFLPLSFSFDITLLLFMILNSVNFFLMKIAQLEREKLTRYEAEEL